MSENAAAAGIWTRNLKGAEQVDTKVWNFKSHYREKKSINYCIVLYKYKKITWLNPFISKNKIRRMHSRIYGWIHKKRRKKKLSWT